jgi:hypothetical protein
MGYTTWSTTDWASYSSTTRSKTTDQIFTKSSIDNSLNPFGVLIRESRDSVANPNSTAVIVGCDVTGSMGVIADHLVRSGIGTFFEEILKRKPITDPHMMIMGIGDAKYDSAPIQVSQFEADLTIAQWLERIYIEHGGGGNSIESYDLPYYFAYNHTSIDCFEKRGKKGYLFTIGDEQAPVWTYADQVKKFIGDDLPEDLAFKDVIEAASRMYNCYHIMIAQGDYARRAPAAVRASWAAAMGQRAIWLTDYTELSELMVSTIQLNEGESKESIISSWSGGTALTISRALDGLDGSSMTAMPNSQSHRVVRF